MTAFVVLALLLAVAAAAWLTRPLWRSAGTRSIGLGASLAVFLFVVAAAGYGWLGAPDQLASGPGSAGAESAATQAHDAEQVMAMVDQLAERLKARPDDARGWELLARAYSSLGRHEQAVDAFRKAIRLKPDDATLLADLAVAIAMGDKAEIQREPVQLIERALKMDARNPKALAFAGMLAFDRKDYAAAVRHWETLEQIEPADSPFTQQIRASIAQARQLGGMPAASAPASAPAAAETAAQVSGTVSLAPALSAKVKPEDTVFVFARAAQGARVPLAILRRQVKDLPLQFTLDDSMAMSPAARLSGAASVIVGARVSRSGNAMPQPGDLQGFAPAAPVGTKGLRIEIGDEVGR